MASESGLPSDFLSSCAVPPPASHNVVVQLHAKILRGGGGMRTRCVTTPHAWSSWSCGVSWFTGTARPATWSHHPAIDRRYPLPASANIFSLVVWWWVLDGSFGRGGSVWLPHVLLAGLLGREGADNYPFLGYRSERCRFEHRMDSEGREGALEGAAAEDETERNNASPPSTAMAFQQATDRADRVSLAISLSLPFTARERFQSAISADLRATHSVDACGQPRGSIPCRTLDSRC